MKEGIPTVLDLLVRLGKAHDALWSIEKPCQKASTSELIRWVKNGAVMINHYVDRNPKEILDYPVVSVVIHPKSNKRKLTLR